MLINVYYLIEKSLYMTIIWLRLLSMFWCLALILAEMKPKSQPPTEPKNQAPDGLRILARLIAREIIARRRTGKGKMPETNKGNRIDRDEDLP